MRVGEKGNGGRSRGRCILRRVKRKKGYEKLGERSFKKRKQGERDEVIGRRQGERER